MLVITVKEDEAATLYDANGNELGKVSVVSIRGEKVRVGFDFPKKIAIARPGVTKEQALAIASGKDATNNNCS
jgi:sRNA-binding carbon storage regulator CsrA